ncbi:VPLPA-CTERM sorting domain-containing protein [Salipiger sp.]|uniref:VPLPA-CTERM sorting domain-containing protein n=1 Tax=Salipiger sp. TaxID=2078585 RepID=UPI003A978675
MKSILLAAGLSLAGTLTSAETVIDTISGQNSGFYCLGVDTGCGQTFGQSFTVGADTRLDSFSFLTAPVTGGAIDVVLRLYEWSGSSRIGAELYASAATALSNLDWDETTWNVGVTLTSGSRYMAYLDASGLGNPTTSSTGFSYISGATYDGGGFFWERTAGDESWNATSADSEFRAVFNAATVPLPATLPLLAGAIGGAVALRRRRKPA